MNNTYNDFEYLNIIKSIINNNEYKYTINPEKISDDIKERFNIKKEQHKQIKQYEDMGYTCK